MPLNDTEKNMLVRGFAHLLTEFGYTGPAMEPIAGIQKHRIATEASDPPQGFYIAAEQLLFRLDRLTDLLTAFLGKALDETERVIGDDKPDPDKKPRGRPKKEAAQGNGAAAPSAPPPTPAPAPQAKSAADDMFPTDEKQADDDPLGNPDEPKQPEQPPLTDVQVKEVLRSYMQAWGAEGTPRLTDLLKRTANVTKFSDLPANKWAAVVDAAKKELAGRNA